MSLNPDLKTILNEAPGKCVPYAVIEGMASEINPVSVAVGQTGWCRYNNY